MNDDFFKSLKDNLDNRPEPTFREGAWKAMEKQLTASKKVESNSVWADKWWLPLLLLLSIGLVASNFGWYQQSKSVNNSHLLVQTDTIYKSQIIIQTDTIYKTNIIKETITLYKNETNNPTENKSNFYTDIGEHSSALNDIAIEQEIANLKGRFEQLASIPLFDNFHQFDNPTYSINSSLLSKLDSNEKLPDNKIVADGKSADLKSIMPILPFDILPILSSGITWQPTASQLLVDIPFVKKRKTLRQQVYNMRPKTFHLGINGGIANTSHSQLNNIGGYTFGLTASIGFSKSFRLWSTGSFLELKYNSTIIDETLGIAAITPPQDNFEFLKAEVTQPAYQFGLGLQYLFNAPNKWKPYLGVGYGVVALVPYEIAYEFTDPITDIDLTLEQVIQQNDLLKGQFLLKAGLEYEFSGPWSWQLEGLYRSGKNKVGLSSPNVWNLKTGLIYRF